MALDLGMKNGFRAISFEYIGEFDSYFIHRYIIRYRPSLITDKIHQLLSELWPLISVCEIGFQVISFEYIGEFEVYFIHRYIIIKYRPSAITDRIHQLLSELWPLISVCEIGFRVISFEYIGILDSYFIHIFMVIKYRSSSITDKIHRLLSELWPFVNDNALFMGIWQKRGHPCPMDTFLVLRCIPP